MAAQEKRVPDLPVANSIVVGDQIVAVSNSSGNTVTQLVPVTKLLNLGAYLGTPANSTSSVVTPGVSWTDGNYFYVATSNNIVKRLGPLQTF